MSPAEMEKAIIRNLPEKTGKSLEEWLQLLALQTDQNKKALKQFLKQEHQLGHFQAQTIVKFFGLKQDKDA